MVTRQFGHPEWWERSFLFLRSNTDKRDITMDLSTPRGRDILRLLVEGADILVENFSPACSTTSELTWDELHAINPGLIMVRMPTFGLDGPWRDNVGFAQTMEQVTGMAWVTGYASDQPRIPRGPCDPMAGMSAAFTMILGLERRDRTGQGSFIEVAMVEGALNAAAEQVIHYTAYGEVLNRDGNRSRDAAPQGLYACRGDDEWLALSITDDAQWFALTEMLGNPSWAADPRLDTLAGRRAEHDVIDQHLGSWAASLDVTETADTLVARGIPAGRLWDARRCADHPQMAARGFFEPLDHPVVGWHSVMRPPFRFASIDRWTRSAGPTLGQHNHEILAELGVDDATIAELTALGVIGTRPQGIDG